MAVTASLRASLDGTHTGTADLGTPSFPFALSGSISFANGTGTGQADRVFSDTRTLAASATENLDLAGSLTDAFGATITFAEIAAILIKADSANTNDVQVTRPASNGVLLFMAAGDGIALKPGAFFAWGDPGATGVTVTAGTGDLLTITNSAGGTGVNYSIVIVGRSA